MTNLEALKSLCNALANTFYPAEATLELTLFNEGIDVDSEATQKDKDILRCAVRLVLGYVEGSRSEGGISTSVRAEAVKASIRSWCVAYGLEADEVLSEELRVIDDGTYLW